MYYLPSPQYPVKVYSRNTGTRWEVCPKLTIKTLEKGHWDRSLLLTLNFFIPYSSVSIVDFEQVIAGWVNTNSFCNAPLLYTCSTCIFVYTLLVYGYMVLFLISVTCKVRRLLEGMLLLEGGVCFDEDTQSCGPYFRPNAY